jgi:hypothetical protein
MGVRLLALSMSAVQKLNTQLVEEEDVNWKRFEGDVLNWRYKENLRREWKREAPEDEPEFCYASVTLQEGLSLLIYQ